MKSIDENIDNVKRMIKNLKHYPDKEKLAEEIQKWIYEISYFYNKIVKEGSNPDFISYKIEPSIRPKEGQIAYFNLRRGYPKETFDDHWCYILRDFGNKYIIIPTTSVKSNSSKCNENYEMDIKINNFENNSLSRLQLTDIRAIDTMRLSKSLFPNVYDVETPREKIIAKIKLVILLDK